MEENPEYPGMYDTAQQDTGDLLHDYFEMLEYKNDSLFIPLIAEYKAELEKRCAMYRDIRIVEQGEGYVIPGTCWYFATWDLIKHYIDSKEE